MTYRAQILIVDDDPLIRDSLEELLIQEGYQVEAVGHSQVALEKAVTAVPDLVLLDVMMPGMTGFEVCHHLRNNPLTAEVPIIFLTALDDRASRLRGIEVGADDFISKPFDILELRARIRGITRLNRYRRLLTERTKFERVVANAETGYLLIDPQDHILFANPKARFFLGLPPNSNNPIEDTFLTLARKQYKTEPQEAWSNWPERSPVMARRYLVQPESATARDFWLQVDTLDRLPTGPTPAWIVSLNDVTFRMSSLRSISQFHVLVSHKLRTPLSGILSSLEILNTRQIPPKEKAQLLAIAYEAARRLHHDIEEILYYINITLSGDSETGFRLGQFPTTIQDICQKLGIHAVVIHLPPHLHQHRLSLSRQAVESILHQVLHNARKFHPQNQPAVIVDICENSSNSVLFRISDDGITLSPEQIFQVWTPYYQGSKHFTGEVKGMGLGLAMVASFVWGAGGECRLFNRPDGPGVVVELILPLNLTEENNG